MHDFQRSDLLVGTAYNFKLEKDVSSSFTRGQRIVVPTISRMVARSGSLRMSPIYKQTRTRIRHGMSTNASAHRGLSDVVLYDNQV